MLACKLNVMAKLRMVGRGHVAHEQPGRNQSPETDVLQLRFSWSTRPRCSCVGAIFICAKAPAAWRHSLTMRRASSLRPARASQRASNQLAWRHWGEGTSGPLVAIASSNYRQPCRTEVRAMRFPQRSHSSSDLKTRWISCRDLAVCPLISNALRVAC